MKRRLLLIEDEPSLVLTLEDRLRAEGYEVHTENDGLTGYERALADDFDLLLLDLHLPGKGGLDICRDLARAKGIDATLKKHRLDAMVAPTGGPPWLIDLVNGDSYTGGSTTPAAVAGYPSITVPAGYAHGLPVGISFWGAAWSEPKLIRIAYAFEQATRVRKPPKLLPTADLGMA